MGWKNVKEHFNISHIVQVKEGNRICIGSGFVSELATIDMATGKVRKNETFSKFLPDNYPALLEATPEEIVQLITTPDTFTASITVYTYIHSDIIEKKCEALDWPNVTHDGQVMYDNTFSADKAQVVKWAKRNAELGVNGYKESVQETEKELQKRRELLAMEESYLAKLEAEYPQVI